MRYLEGDLCGCLDQLGRIIPPPGVRQVLDTALKRRAAMASAPARFTVVGANLSRHQSMPIGASQSHRIEGVSPLATDGAMCAKSSDERAPCQEGARETSAVSCPDRALPSAVYPGSLPE